jgi:hypothetical protein
MTAIVTGAIMGENALTIMFSMVSYIDIPVGSYVDYQASRYTLLKPQNFTKNNTRDLSTHLYLTGRRLYFLGSNFVIFQVDLNSHILQNHRNICNCLLII